MDLKIIKATLEELAEEKGISKDKVIETIEMALAAAYKRDYGKRGQIVRAVFDLDSGGISFSQVKIVVDESMLKSEEEVAAEETSLRPEREDEIGGEQKRVRFNPERHIMVDEAHKIKKDAELGEELVFPLETHADYGRIAAQTAKQVIIQRIREAEREAIYEEFKEKQGEVVSGIVQRIEGRNVYLDLGRTTALLPAEEQVQHERYRTGERIKGLLLMSERQARVPLMYLSRSHPRFVSKLFEIEVPEISQGIVEIKGLAREAGSRSKIAVISHDQSIDPVGSLVGQKGVRVGTVIAELGGEKIDIIEWSDDPTKFIANALSPAKVLDVTTDEETHTATVMVEDTQLSLAIGRNGQNVRLAAKLTSWKIDIATREGREAHDTDTASPDESEKTEETSTKEES
ncbi:MAG: transcription termination/antitermination protein NusA [Candidatus Ryanbacteria bacterium]|nr:transcription termination/antitermination protein NusA [Candidatus Ryanbacteria bacterium]